MLSSGPVSQEAFPALLRARLLEAITYRRKMAGLAFPPGEPGVPAAGSASLSNACRLVFSEADLLPGLIIDRFHDILALQILSQALDQPWVRETLAGTLREQLQPAAIVERTAPRAPELEEPAGDAGTILYGERTETVFTLNGLRFHYDARSGQKTGAFLDQRENYAAAEGWASGNALDVFCYQGGFALHLARRCAQVTAVDSSRPALETGERNATLNPALAPIEWMEANAFELLRDYAASGRKYDTIVLDPPAFAKARRERPSALRGYKELNLRALKMLSPGGVLVTCSCSFHVSEADFLDVLRSAAADARRSPRVLERRGQAADHPVLLSVPETAYLKCVILQV
jgi:23S rRNA (cytosine1962-C5)-methyltransferase